MASVTEIAPGLLRWTAHHGEWHEDVGSVAVETRDGLVLIDPMEVPRGLRTPAHVLLTVYWHGRATRGAGAERVWAPVRSARPLRHREIAVSDEFRPGDPLPGGIQAFATPRVSEVVYWLPDHRALVVGDVLLGAGAKPEPTGEPLRLCPQRWLGKGTHDGLRAALEPLLELPLEHVVVSHGPPVVGSGKAALAAVVRPAAPAA